VVRRTLPWLLLLSAAGCTEYQKESPSRRIPNLYVRLGGEEGLNRLANALVARVTICNDPDSVKPTWTTERKAALVSKLSTVAGGPPREGTLELTREEYAVLEALVKERLKAQPTLSDDNRQHLLAQLRPLEPRKPAP
jgi:hypothetical protein